LNGGPPWANLPSSSVRAFRDQRSERPTDGKRAGPSANQTATSGGDCWPTIKPSKGWPLATRLRRAKGLDRACCSAFVSHQAFDGEVRNAGAASRFTFTETTYTNYLTIPDRTVSSAKQQPSGIRRDVAPIERGHNFAAFDGCKTEQVWGTVCRHRVIPWSELNRSRTTIFSDSGPRCTSFSEIFALATPISTSRRDVVEFDSRKLFDMVFLNERARG
jgi:hypothetical protein